MNSGCEQCTSASKWTDGSIETVEVHEDGPTFLKRCISCKTLWHESLHDLRMVSLDEARWLYPNANLSGDDA